VYIRRSSGIPTKAPMISHDIDRRRDQHIGLLPELVVTVNHQDD
jgi:hypothetical protein